MFPLTKGIKPPGNWESNERKYRNLAESITEILFSLDSDFHITYWNRAAEKIGITREQALGKTIYDIFPYIKGTSEEKNYLEVLNTGNCQRFNVRWHLNKQIFYLEVSVFPCEEGISILARDITEHLKAERQLRELEIQLQQTQKMDALGILAGGIAHDFNNLLSVILGYVSLSIEALPEDSLSSRYLKPALESAQRAEDLVKQILNFARMDNIRLKTVDPTEKINEALRFLSAITPTNITLKKNLGCIGETIQIDESQLYQVLINLGTNARQAMEESGGIMEIITRKLPFQDCPLASGLDHYSYKYCLQIMVRDSGPGIPENELTRIFEPFYTTRKDNSRTGLGLAVVKRIMDKHEGKIIIKSKVGEGTCVSLYFPIISEQELSPLPDTIEKNNLVRGCGNILLVEDELALLKLYSKMLESIGYKVTPCENGKQAWRTFNSNPELFDLLLTNLDMPALSGQELAKEIHAIDAEIPILMTSGFGDAFTEKAARENGVKELLIKPIHLDHLSQVLHRYLPPSEKR